MRSHDKHLHDYVSRKNLYFYNPEISTLFLFIMIHSCSFLCHYPESQINLPKIISVILPLFHKIIGLSTTIVVDNSLTCGIARPVRSPYLCKV